MALREKEKNFAKKVLNKIEKNFFENNCKNCHIKRCRDCHQVSKKKVLKPTIFDCLRCHNGYHIGIEYIGLSLRDPSYRYKRGILFQGKYYLEMRADVHHKHGLVCYHCHSMKSLIMGKKSSKKCLDCHKLNLSIYEHQIKAHIKKMECFTCHSLWINQEYGTFLIKNYRKSKIYKYGIWDKISNNIIKSVYYVKRDLFPLAINENNKLSPVRPEYIFIYSNLKNKRNQNILMSNRWKCIFPHSISKSAPLCSDCHMKKWRFLQECKEGRSPISIFDVGKDIKINKFNFVCFLGATISNGIFYTKKNVFNITNNPCFIKGYLKKWKYILQGVN